MKSHEKEFIKDWSIPFWIIQISFIPTIIAIFGVIEIFDIFSIAWFVSLVVSIIGLIVISYGIYREILFLKNSWDFKYDKTNYKNKSIVRKYNITSIIIILAIITLVLIFTWNLSKRLGFWYNLLIIFLVFILGTISNLIKRKLFTKNNN